VMTMAIDPCWTGKNRGRFAQRSLALCLALVTTSVLGAPDARAQTARGKAAQQLAAEQEAAEKLAALKSDFEKQLAEQEAAAKQREETLRAEQAAAVTAAQKDAEAKLADERAARQADTTRLQQAIDEAKQREEKRAREAPPQVEIAGPGVSLYGLVQADYQIRQSSQDQINPDTGLPLNQDRFLIRRARLGVAMKRTYGEGGLELDANTVNGPTMRLLDAHASAMLPGEGPVPLVMASIGLLKVPFGFEVGQANRGRLFLERSTAAQAFFPDAGEGYDLGARIQGGWRFLRYAVVVQNGELLGSGRFAGLDPNHQKDIAGRAGIDTEIVEGIHVSGGVSLLRGTGFHQGTPATKGTVAWIDYNSNGTIDSGELVGIQGSVPGTSTNFSRFAVGGDLQFSINVPRLGRATVYGEVYSANDLDRGVVPADPLSTPKGEQAHSFRELGYYAAVTQELGRHLAVGLRYDFYDPDRDSYRSTMGNVVPRDMSYRTFAFAAALIAPEWGRLILEYDINRNHLGLDGQGNPANLADNAFVLRGEVHF